MPRRSHRGQGTILSQKLIEEQGIEVLVIRKKIKSITLRVKDSKPHVQVSAPSYVPEETIRQMVRDKRSWILAQQERIASSPKQIAANATKDEQAQWKALVSACVPALIEAWEPIMGVKARKLAYRNMTSRWGSCQPSTGRICINTRLALYPPECLEYVVVHELCHLLEPSHNAQFHALMDTFMPDWKSRKDKLR